MNNRFRSCGAVVFALLLSIPAAAQVSQADIDTAQSLFAEKQYPEASKAFLDLRARLGPRQGDLAATLDFNRACAELAADQLDAAEGLLLDVDNRTRDRALRAAARYNLGQIAIKRADALAKEDAVKAGELARAAERHFRNVLTDNPGDADAARNIELIQRRYRKPADRPPEEKDKKDQSDNEQKKQDQEKKDEKKDEQDQQKDQEKKDQQQQDQQDKKEQTPDKQSEQPKDGQSKDEQKKQEGKDQESKDRDAKEQKADEAKDGTDDQKPAARQSQPQPTAKEKREFDRKAAEILDRERKQRERIKQYMQMMRARAAPVEKDW